MSGDETDALVEVAQKAIADRLSWASMHWGTEKVSPDAWPHIARAAVTALLRHGLVYLPCDEGCTEYAEECCSRHGRKPAEIWALLADATRVATPEATS